MAEHPDLTQGEPPKKRSRARPAKTAAVAEPPASQDVVQSLLQEVRALAGQVASLRGELEELRSDRANQAPQAVVVVTPPEEVLPPTPEPEAPPPAETQPFRPKPFDHESFAVDFQRAVANPDDVVWDEGFPPAEAPNLDPLEPGLEHELLERMKERYPQLFQEIDQYNRDLGLVPEESPIEEAVPVADPLEAFYQTSAELVDLSEPIQEQTPNLGEFEPLDFDEQEEPVVEIGFSAFHGGADVNATEHKPHSPTNQATGNSPHPDALAAVPLELAAAAFILPLRLEGGTLHCLAAEPVNKDGLQGLGAALGLTVQPQPASISEVVKGLRKAYSGESELGARDELISPARQAGTQAAKFSIVGLVKRVLRRAA